MDREVVPPRDVRDDDGREYSVREIWMRGDPPPALSRRSATDGMHVQVETPGLPTLEVTLRSDWRSLTDAELLSDLRSGGAANGGTSDDATP
jgi:hypothetical protein